MGEPVNPTVNPNPAPITRPCTSRLCAPGTVHTLNPAPPVYDPAPVYGTYYAACGCGVRVMHPASLGFVDPAHPDRFVTVAEWVTDDGTSTPAAAPPPDGTVDLYWMIVDTLDPAADAPGAVVHTSDPDELADVLDPAHVAGEIAHNAAWAARGPGAAWDAPTP